MGAVNAGSPNAVIRQRMQVERVEGPFTRIIKRVEASTVTKQLGNGVKRDVVVSKYVDDVQQVPFGYMCYFPSGHSVFVYGDDEKKIEQYGILKPVIAVDMATGEQFTDAADLPLTPKQIVEATTNRPRGRTASAAS